MPFGKKKDKNAKEKSGYPTQAQPGAYPQAQPQPQGYAPQQMSAAPPPYGQEPPPPYSAAQAAAAAPPPPQGYYPPPPQQQAGYFPPPQYPAQPYPTARPAQPPQSNTTVVVQGGFDAGARFDGISQPNIPPPPPGCMPNAAQMAMNRGNNVVVSQRQGSFWEGGSDGGYTIF